MDPFVPIDEVELASVRIRLRSSEGWKAKSKPASVFTAVIRAVISAIFTRRFWRSVSSSASKVSIASSAVISPRSNAGHGSSNKPEITPPSHSYHRPDGTTVPS